MNPNTRNTKQKHPFSLAFQYLLRLSHSGPAAETASPWSRAGAHAEAKGAPQTRRGKPVREAAPCPTQAGGCRSLSWDSPHTGARLPLFPRDCEDPSSNTALGARVNPRGARPTRSATLLVAESRQPSPQEEKVAPNAGGPLTWGRASQTHGSGNRLRQPNQWSPGRPLGGGRGQRRP